MNEVDVAIVGAGPAGSSTAITLAQRGYRVALLDRAVFPRDKLCGDFLNPINWPVLDDLQVAADLLRLPHAEVSSFRISAADGAEAFSALPAPGGRRLGLGLRRVHLDHALLQSARRAGASIDEGVRLKTLVRRSHGWRLEMDRRGDAVSIGARFLVGADGRNSWVARQLGVASAPPKRNAAVGFEIQLRGIPGLCNSVEIHQFIGGYAGLVRVGDDRINLCFTVNRPLLRQSISLDNLRRDFLRGNPLLDGLLSASEVLGSLRSVWPVYFPARRCFGDGFLLVGDAARVTEPVTGEGIFLALRSGQLAGTTLAAALADGCSNADRLAAYERACRAEFAGRLRLNSAIRYLVYRPRLLSSAIRFLDRRQRLLDSLVHAVCQQRAVLAG